MVIKMFLYQRGFNSTYTGGVSSFLLFNLILTFLRDFYKKRYERQARQGMNQESPLSELMMKFLQFYAQFDINGKQIIVRQGGDIRPKRQKVLGFSLLSPIDDRDIGSQAFRIREIFSVFGNRYNYMTNIQYKDGESVLRLLLNPSEKDFKIYLS